MKSGPLSADGLRHRDGVCTSVHGLRHWLWRAVDEYGRVCAGHFPSAAPRHQSSEDVPDRLLVEYDVPEVMHTDQLRSCGAAVRRIPSFADVDCQQVTSTVRCSNVIEHSHCPHRDRSGLRKIQTAKTRSRIPEFARSSDRPPPSLPHQRHRHAKKQPEHSVPDVVNKHGRVDLKFRSSCPQPAVKAVKAAQPNGVPGEHLEEVQTAVPQGGAAQRDG